jgi:hypothetical protein
MSRHSDVLDGTVRQLQSLEFHRCVSEKESYRFWLSTLSTDMR